jgi:hypothetical protein
MAKAQMNRAAAQEALEGVRAAMHDQHPGNGARLEQLDSHMATVAMLVDHLYDEAARGEES